MTGGSLASVETSSGSIQADRLVLATGAAPSLPGRISGIDIPQRSTPGIIAITKPMPPLINRVIAAPGVHLHQRNDGRVVLGEQDGAPKTDAHKMRLETRPNTFPAREFAQQHGDRMLAVARKFVPALQDAVIDDAYIGWRPLPLDGHPVLGTSTEKPDIYLAIMHSGVSLAPIVGQLVTQELALAKPVKELEPYRPTRSFQQVRRY